MRSTVSIKGMAVSLVVFFIAVSLLCYLFFYRPKSIKVKKGSRDVSSLNGRFEKAMLDLNKIRAEIERFNKEEVNVDYFKRHQIPPEQRTPTFLAKVNDVVNRLGIKTIMVKPMPQEESDDYIRYPFLVETKSKYEEIVKFVDSLENSFGLNLDDLHIENDPKDPLWHRLKFTVSTFELKKTEASVPEKMAKGEVSPIQVVVRDDIVVKRDPFLEKKLEREKRITTASIRKKRPKRVSRLKLNGIIDIGGKKVAIINDKIVREGDWIARHHILQIGEDEVITVYGRKKRTLKIKELVKTK
ncbi:MAG: type 4a pilus biogenesis protein PilO [Syntrophobacterales bacterium]|nr:MAG: type 4a pilus biogenesis protein PilO [Syntrophobacterales bacterium]